MSSSLDNTRAVVTGAASGIGRAIAQELSARGATVIACDVNEAGLAETLSTLGEGCSTHVSDVSDHAQVEALAAHVSATLGGCDMLFANAGVIAAGRYTRITAAEVDWILGVNVRGVWSTTSVFARMMEQQPEGGRICFTGSEHSLGYQHAGAAVYTASKHAVLGLAEILRAEAPENLHVSIFCPGLVGTALGGGGRPEGLPAQQRNLDMSARIQARGMPVDEAARDAVDGTLRGDLYIVTHSHTIRAAEKRLDEMQSAFAAQAPWERNADRYEVNSVIAAVAADMKAEAQ
ncbi:MAG: SDR family NAD(P)-dependent oxidoreductase [Blastomonas fulva]|uniref:SDR family NAD(P)-dependent oxidoreductase n=1 Tax=Blastomonas fulva TaxID=1550728 RepID=UPI004034614A